jgi:subtilisin family serine protease
MRRLPVLVGAGLVAAVTAALPGPLPAAAAPPPAAPATAAAAAPQAGAAARLAAGSYDVTLVTGDRVRLTVLADGHQSAAVAPAARDDGRTPSMQTQVLDGRLYVIPDDAAGYLGTRLDRELFDVTALVRAGYDDRSAAAVPVIVEYRGSAGALPPAMTETGQLRSIGAVAARVSKKDAKVFGQAVAEQSRRDAPAAPGAASRRAAPTGLFAGIDKIWLDARATVSDEDSAPQIGAPAAWAAGYTGTGVTVAVLDTGVDTSHPDLAGKVAESVNFSDADSSTDHFGHGSHVASIIAGSGAASNGARQGIGFGASLLNVKVLNDAGSGLDSGIIAGAEWAAQHGAKVANLSLGTQGFHGDGTDPLSAALNKLTDQYGTLFVVAAGNDGAADQTITAPGAADKVLTVGAVDKHDVLAPFSSRGPRFGDYAIKPDITAPGVDILAARAAGTSLGSPLDANYTSLSGTSMATPHVAGAAAVFLQEHPGWTPEQVKAALVSTAAPAPAGYTVYQQGGGRVDLARATRQTVYAGTPSLSLGYFPFPQADDQPVTKPISYRNTGSGPVTLTLAAGVTDEHGTPAAAGVLTLGASTVTVPPGGSQDLAVTIDPRLGDFGRFGGYVTATDAASGTVLHTPIGFYRESVRYNLTVQGIARDGRPAGGISSLDVINVDDRTRFLATLLTFTDGTATLRVPPGNYAVLGYLFTYDEPGVFALDGAAVHRPEVAVNADTTVVLDGRQAKEIVPKTKDPTEPATITLDYYRADATGGAYEHSFTLTPPISHAFAAATQPVRTGKFEFYSAFSLQAPLIRLHTTTPAVTDLHPLYAAGSPQLDGHVRLPVVYVGLGRSQDYAGLDVRGKIALVRRGEITFLEKMRTATANGAALVLIFNHSPGLLFIGGAPDTAPTLSLSQAEGEALVALAGTGPLTIDATGIKVSPYLYDVIFPEPDRIPAVFNYQVSDRNAATIDASYHSDGAPRPAGDVRFSWRPWQGFAFGFLRPMPSPLRRTEYVSTGDTRWQQNVYAYSPQTAPFTSGGFEPVTTYQPRQRLANTWWAQPNRPGALPADLGPSAVRDGDTLTLAVPEFGDAAGHWGWRDSAADSSAFRLYRDGQLVTSAERASGPFGLAAAPATYRLELDVARTADWWPLSTRTGTAWTVRSTRPRAGTQTVLPLLTVDYAVRLDPLNRTTRPELLDLSVGHLPGSTDPALIAGARVWVSYNSGASWAAAPTLPTGHNGQFRALLLRRPARTDGYVSLRVEAWDIRGNRIQQTIIRGYALPTG